MQGSSVIARGVESPLLWSFVKVNNSSEDIGRLARESVQKH